MFHRILLIVIFITIIVVREIRSCELDQTQHGCRIDNGQCTCAFGCRSEFRYSTRKECQDALKGRSNDICNRLPCKNGGSCIQVSQMPGYKCRCDGTGYWGNRCQILCPNANEYHLTQFPYECILI